MLKAKSINKSIVYVKFPKTGLGNMLLLWAKATVFARLNHLEVFTTSWFGFRWGALLRQEQKKRLYRKYFIETPLAKRMLIGFYLKLNNVVIEPAVELVPQVSPVKNTVYVFNQVMTEPDLFRSIRNHSQLVRDELYKSLHPTQKLSLKNFEGPVIGVHIRRGDFTLGSIITPLSFFIEGIEIIRTALKECLPVTVFTDAGIDELAPIFELPNVKLAEKKADILDVMLLAKSKVLLLSATSTFSYFAGFLSTGLIIMPVSDWLGSIRGRENSALHEMKWDHTNEASTKDLIKQLSLLPQAQMYQQ